MNFNENEVLTMDMKSIGKRIRECRKKKGWNRETFAEKIGLSTTFTGMLERGEKTPGFETFITILNVLEVSADLILSDVTNVGYTVKSTELSEKLATLNPEARERIFAALSAMIDYEKKNSFLK